MPGSLKIHAILYSWPSVQSKAFQIAKDLAGHAHRVSVVTCTDDPIDVPEGVETFVLPNSCYFGQQFKKTIEVFEGDVLLQIAADTTTESWGAVVRQCEARFQSVPSLGIWTPEIDGTTWPNSRVQLYQTNDPQLVGVVQTDCIVWAVRSDIVAYLRTLDYSPTPLGWGADWAAIAHAYANKLRVMRDAAVKIHHPVGTGYNRDEANRQKDAFLSALSDDEKIQLSMMSGVIDGRTAALTARPASAAPPAETVSNEAQSARTFAFHLKTLGASRLLDIGGDTGGFAKSLRRQGYDGMIYSVEPRAVAYAQLVANAAEDPKWSPLLRQGVGAKAGYLDLAPANQGRAPSALQAALSQPSAGSGSRAVEMERIHASRLDDLLDSAVMSAIDAVKISVDGYDRKAWSSYEAVLKAARLLLVEVSLVDRDTGANDVFVLDKFLVN